MTRKMNCEICKTNTIRYSSSCVMCQARLCINCEKKMIYKYGQIMPDILMRRTSYDFTPNWWFMPTNCDICTELQIY